MKNKEKAKRTTGYRGVIISKKSKPQKRIIVGIPMTGLLRSEWVLARYGQVIPCNWSQNDFVQWVDQWSPLSFQVADARNIIVKAAVEGEYENLIFIDHDCVLPPNFLLTMNDYILEGEPPIVSGLYFTKSIPSEPLIYRGRGNGYYNKWKIGDKVWVDGHGMGATLINCSILKALYEESEEYVIAGQKLRKVYETPARVFYDPETHSFNNQIGTEDLEFLSRIMRDNILEKAGWSKYAKKKYPFLVDTTLFAYHIDWDGNKYPMRGEQLQYMRK